MRRSVAAVALALLPVALAGGCAEETNTPEAAAGAEPEAPAVDLSPGGWPAGEWEKYLALEDVAFPGNPLVEGRQGAVAGSFHA
ncbi:MAG: hypothetical protein F4X99_08965, partial [Gammaproteobacteria bacterium]|nr:hypothetical protein [Gammaproteobacteria bacterium]